MPVARAERPNKARNGLVMLPSASAMAGWSAGMGVKGSGMWRRVQRAGSRGSHDRRAGDVYPILAAILTADSGFERQVQHPAGGHGRMRADFQTAGYAAGDCEPGEPGGG